MKRVIVTGAASGLGRAIALRYAREEADICIADVNMDGAKETQALVESEGGKAWIFSLDVRVPEQWEILKAEVQARWDGLDVLVNNAGVGAGDRIEQGHWEDWEWIIDINLKGVVLGCRAFTAMMKAQGSGHILNTASLAGLMNLPGMASYNVTKAGVVALSETIHYELEPYGIGVTVLCPSFFKTNLGSSLRTTDPTSKERLAKLYEASELDADQVADIAYQSMQRNQLICNPHKLGKRAYFVKRYLPWLFSFAMRKAAKETKKGDPELVSLKEMQ